MRARTAAAAALLPLALLARAADDEPLREPPLPAHGIGIALASQPVALDPGDPTRATLGAFEFRGALQLASPHPRFGGFSAVEVDGKGDHLLALSDEGAWLEARLAYDRRGWLARADHGRLGALADESGQALGGKADGDAEAFTRLPDGSYSASPRFGDRVDIGANAVIIGPITVGDDAAIGAGAVVVKDVPAGHIAVGNPARILPRRRPA